MAKIIGVQTIPSALEYAYSGILVPNMPNNIVRKRYPWDFPKRKDGTANCSPSQKIIRDAFSNCVECYNNSPMSGGVTPPDIGYRSREWWYAAAAASGLWYYDYFIQQSIPIFLVGSTPDWCKPAPIGDAFVLALDRYTNFGSSDHLFVHDEADMTLARSYIKHPDLTKNTYNFYAYKSQPTWKAGRYWTIYIYDCIDDNWNENTITWANQPGKGAYLTQVTVNLIPGWFSFTLPINIDSFVMEWENGSVDPLDQSWLEIYSAQGPEGLTPYYT